MSAKEFTLWQLYREFQKELEQLKRDMERINQIRDELTKLGSK